MTKIACGACASNNDEDILVAYTVPQSIRALQVKDL